MTHPRHFASTSAGYRPCSPRTFFAIARHVAVVMANTRDSGTAPTGQENTTSITGVAG